MGSSRSGNSTESTGFSWFTWLLVVLLIVVTAVVAIPNYIKSHTPASKSACIAYLKQLEGAKEEWALVNKKELGYRLRPEDVRGMAGYLKNSALPECPDGGGAYEIGPIGSPPRCRIAWHTL